MIVLFVTLNDMIHHGKAVKRGASDTFIVVDMPIGTVGLSDEEDLKCTSSFIKTRMPNAVKVEGLILHLFKKQLKWVYLLFHLGLTPQSVGVMGYKLKGIHSRYATYQRC